MLHGLSAVNHAPAGGDDGMLCLNGCVDPVFHLSETVVSLPGNDFMQKEPRLFLNHKIRIQKSKALVLCQNHAHGALSGPRHPDQDDVPHSSFSRQAITSTSQRTSLGSCLTATQLLAGFWEKYSPYTSLNAPKSAISARKQVVLTTES